MGWDVPFEYRGLKFREGAQGYGLQVFSQGKWYDIEGLNWKGTKDYLSHQIAISLWENKRHVGEVNFPESPTNPGKEGSMAKELKPECLQKVKERYNSIQEIHDAMEYVAEADKTDRGSGRRYADKPLQPGEKGYERYRSMLDAAHKGIAALSSSFPPGPVFDHAIKALEESQYNINLGAFRLAQNFLADAETSLFEAIIGEVVECECGQLFEEK